MQGNDSHRVFSALKEMRKHYSSSVFLPPKCCLQDRVIQIHTVVVVWHNSNSIFITQPFFLRSCVHPTGSLRKAFIWLSPWDFLFCWPPLVLTSCVDSPDATRKFPIQLMVFLSNVLFSNRQDVSKLYTVYGCLCESKFRCSL